MSCICATETRDDTTKAIGFNTLLDVYVGRKLDQFISVLIKKEYEVCIIF